MRYAILSDIHGNYRALQAAFRSLEGQGIDAYLCAGDVVGYGPEPERCVDAVRERCVTTVAGNHDHACCGLRDTTHFNPYAKAVAHWTSKHLSPAAKQWLAELPFVAHFEHFTIAHGSAHSPEAFHYITSIFEAELSFDCLDKSILFYGHTHVPLAFFSTKPTSYAWRFPIQIDLTQKTLVNVGSVGHPRDEDPRACYAIYDTSTRVVELRRSAFEPYDTRNEFSGLEFGASGGLPAPRLPRFWPSPGAGGGSADLE